MIHRLSNCKYTTVFDCVAQCKQVHVDQEDTHVAHTSKRKPHKYILTAQLCGTLPTSFFFVLAQAAVSCVCNVTAPHKVPQASRPHTL